MRHAPSDSIVFTCAASAAIAAILGAATLRLGRALRAANTAPSARDHAVVAA
jgi:hypothetical protein